MSSWVLFDDDTIVNLATGRTMNLAGNKINYKVAALDTTPYKVITYSSPEVAQEKWRTLTQLLAAPFGTFALKE